MRKFLPISILAAGLAGCGVGAAGGDPTAEALDSLFEARYDDPAAPGGAVLIAKGDSVIYERYFGVADMATGERVGEETMFNIASVSKQFTVAALLRQDVGIDEPASAYFPYPQEFWRRVTLGHLASHSSGIPDSRDRSDRQRCVYADDEASIAYFPTVDTLLFEPGTAYDYLNPSFILLAKVVEQKTGQGFCEYMRQSVFEPLGMSRTAYFSPAGMPQGTAHGYAPDGRGGWQECDYGEETFFATRPDGGIYSTARDMLRWELGLAQGRVLSPERLAIAYEPRVDVAGSPYCDYQRRPGTSYGLGWFVERQPGRPDKVYHTGDNGGFQAYVAKYPSHGISIIVLENRHDRDRWQMAAAIDSVLSARNFF